MENSLIHKQFEQLELYCQGTIGVAATHIEQNINLNHNASQSFLMCSTYKLPIAIYLLYLTEQQTLNLDGLYQVTQKDLVPGVLCTLNQFTYEIPLHISIRNLLRIMLQESSNSASDIILKLVGGPEQVTKWLQLNNISTIKIKNYAFDSLCKWDGVSISRDDNYSIAKYNELEKNVDKANLKASRQELIDHIFDTCTPLAMNLLLQKLFKSKLINQTNTNLILQIMQGCKRGLKRLKGILPTNVNLAHKTGTLPGFTNDVGIMTLPFNAGNVAISAYIKNSTKDLTNNEQVLAEVGRIIYDYFLNK